METGLTLLWPCEDFHSLGFIYSGVNLLNHVFAIQTTPLCCSPASPKPTTVPLLFAGSPSTQLYLYNMLPCLTCREHLHSPTWHTVSSSPLLPAVPSCSPWHTAGTWVFSPSSELQGLAVFSFPTIFFFNKNKQQNQRDASCPVEGYPKSTSTKKTAPCIPNCSPCDSPGRAPRGAHTAQE